MCIRDSAERMSQNPVYESLLPKNKTARNTRNTEVYQERFARSDRLYNSPLYAIRRLLNNTPNSDRFNNPDFVDLSHVFNDPDTN